MAPAKKKKKVFTLGAKRGSLLGSKKTGVRRSGTISEKSFSDVLSQSNYSESENKQIPEQANFEEDDSDEARENQTFDFGKGRGQSFF